LVVVLLVSAEVVDCTLIEIWSAVVVLLGLCFVVSTAEPVAAVALM